MKNIRVIVEAVVLAGLLSGTLSYKLGRSNGFDQGWDKGYIRGLENLSSNPADTSKDPEEVCINGQCEAEEN